jgi:mono/diheme cytochrome c family protein
MKSGKLLITTAIGLCLALPTLASADGAATYKAKCAGCHGAEGQGKVGPALKGTSKSADEIATFLTTGDDSKKAPHKKPVGGLTADDAKAVAEYVKSLK